MKKNKTNRSTNRVSRLSIRIDTARKAVIARAAESQGATLSDFVLENAFQMATVLLADEGELSLTKKQVAYIFDCLDNPPAQNVAAIQKLLKTPSVLDG